VALVLSDAAAETEQAAPLGTIVAPCKAGAVLNDYMVDLLAVTARLLCEACVEIAQMHVGGQLAWLPDGIAGADSAARLLLPHKLQEHARATLRDLDPKLISELKSYNAPPDVIYRVCLGVYCVLGRKPKDLGGWSQVREALSEKLLGEMEAFDATARGKKLPWSRSRKATKGLSSDEVFKKGSLPVQILFKWLDVERLVRKVCVALRKEEAEAEAEAEAAAAAAAGVEEDDPDEEEEEEEE